uniref:RING-type domain-containing protein n=1 Tax=Pyramimonas obovata TaxID=1411642 RepID=A0A7S0WEY2_9CHLO|mmetsp:Transcript_23887/g.52176  ORF Transcript_23887/g.52176 Transcript_23887/m.52176 type:complete len:496 (+) Transcript_23887:219-1706(+)
MSLNCKICYEPAKQDNSQAQVTQCGHVFCSDCISLWFKTEKSCPLCRRPHTKHQLIHIFEESPEEAAGQTQNVDDPLEELALAKKETLKVQNVLAVIGDRWRELLIDKAKLRQRVNQLEEETKSLQAQLEMECRAKEAAEVKAKEAVDEAKKLYAVPAATLPRTPSAELRRSVNKYDTEVAGLSMQWQLDLTNTTMHSEPIHGIAMAQQADGSVRIATASWDQTSKVVRPTDDSSVIELTGHTHGLYAVDFSHLRPSLIGTVSSDACCKLWELDTDRELGSCVGTLKGHRDEVNGISFHRQNSWVATASDDMTAIIWDTSTETIVTQLTGHKAVVYGVCFQPLGPLVATVSFDYTCKLWDPRQAKVVKSLEGHQDDIIGVDMSAVGNLLATGSDDTTCCIWDIRNWQAASVLRDHTQEVKRIAFSPAGSMLATTSGDMTVRLFNMRSFECISTLKGHTDHVFDVCWNSEGNMLASASHDKTWRLWSPRLTSRDDL